MKKTSFKSQYDLVIEQFQKEKKVKIYGERENLAIMRELNDGMEDFLETQKLTEHAAEMATFGIELNA